MNLNKFRALLLICIFLTVPSVFATNYFVDGSAGDDSWDGKFSSWIGGSSGPKRTIKAALAISVDGDIIQVESGAYAERVNLTKAINFVLATGNSSITTLLVDIPNKKAFINNNELIVTDSLILKNGVMDASLATLVAGANCKVTGGSRTSFVESKLTRANTGTSVVDLFFPIGTGKDYRPVFMSFGQSASSQNRYTAQVYAVALAPAPMPSWIKFISKVHFWNVKYSGSATANQFRFKIQYDSTKNDDEVFDPGKLRLVINQNPGGKFIDLGGSGSAKYFGSITATNKTDTLANLTLANVVGGVNTLGRKEPSANFGWVGQCVNADVQFRDSSVTNKSTIVARKWDFGTGNPKDTSSAKNPKFKFPGLGPFTVTLVVVNNLGFDDTIRKNIVLKKGPKSFFPNGDNCFGTAINFKDSSTVDAPDTIKTRIWDLGNSIFKFTKTFSYTYPAAGKYKVQLITNSNSGCVDTFKKDINVFKKPNPNFTFNNVCFNETTVFNATGGNIGDTITQWNWVVNSVLDNTGKKYNKKFSASGNYVVQLAVKSQSGCPDTSTQTVTIYKAPVASFILDKSVVRNDSIQCFKYNKFTFKDISTSFQGQSLTPYYYWGSSQSLLSNSESRSTGGTFPVKMKIISDKGCMDSTAKNYKVYGLIDMKYTVATYCLPTPADFLDSTEVGSGFITDRDWEFGDGAKGSGPIATHAYPNGGIYTAKLIITTSEGCVDSLDRTVQVTNKPNLTLTKGTNNPLCTGSTFRVQAIGGVYVVWNDLDTNRLRFLTTAGKYIVRAHTSPFCFIEDSVDLKTYPKVFANAGRDTSVVRGRYIVLRGDGGIIYEWTPRNECETPDSIRTKVKPQATMLYHLKVTDGNGCSDFDSVLVRVVEPLYIRIPNLITPNEDGKNDAWDLREVPNIEAGKISIYSAVGELVFEQTSGYSHNWKGTSTSGQPLPTGNYLYVIEVPSEKEPFTGFLQIARQK